MTITKIKRSIAIMVWLGILVLISTGQTTPNNTPVAQVLDQ